MDIGGSDNRRAQSQGHVSVRRPVGGVVEGNREMIISSGNTQTVRLAGQIWKGRKPLLRAPNGRVSGMPLPTQIFVRSNKQASSASSQIRSHTEILRHGVRIFGLGLPRETHFPPGRAVLINAPAVVSALVNAALGLGFYESPADMCLLGAGECGGGGWPLPVAALGSLDL